MTLVVGYDRHPASRAALLFAAELAGALTAWLHVVHVVDMSDSPLVGASAHPNQTTQRYLQAEQQHVRDTLDAMPVQWTYHLMNGDPADALLAAAHEHAASMIVVGKPEQGLGATLGHLLINAVTHTLIRRSDRPVVVVPENVEELQ